MITYTEGSRRFNYRIAAVFIDEGHLLVHRAETDPFWALPGGRAEMRELAADTVRREMREELGIGLAELREAGRVEVTGSHKRTLLHCFEARPDAPRLRLAAAEIAEARWAPAGAPPQPLGPDAATLLERFAG